MTVPFSGRGFSYLNSPGPKPVEPEGGFAPGVVTPGYYVPAPLGLSEIERHRAARFVHSV